MFTTISKIDIIILATFNMSSANALNLVQSKNLLFGNELVIFHSYWNGSEEQLHGWRTEPPTTLFLVPSANWMNSEITVANRSRLSWRTKPVLKTTSILCKPALD